jgi:hypothetical protein
MRCTTVLPSLASIPSFSVHMHVHLCASQIYIYILRNRIIRMAYGEKGNPVFV